MRHTLKLSVILPTDNCDTIKPVIQRLRRQEMSDQIELVFITPAAETFEGAESLLAEFGSVKILKAQSLTPLSEARVLGLRAASGTFVFLGETHSYAQKGWAAALLAAAEAGPWVAVSPGIENANPKRLLSFVGYLADYARWGGVLSAGEIDEAPIYNALYRREELLAIGDKLAGLLSHGVGLKAEFAARGYRSYLEPSARLLHLNVEQTRACFYERYLAGVLIGSQRAGQWSKRHRLAYICGSFLIPIVLIKRMLPGIHKAAETQKLPWSTFPLLTLLTYTKAWGEVIGYAGLGRHHHEVAMDALEIRKVDFLAGKQR